MTASEQAAFLEASQAWIAGQMGGAVNEALALRNLFKKGWNEEKLRILLGKNVADDIMSRINREAAFGKSDDVVAGNSETARRAAAQSEVAPQFGRTDARRAHRTRVLCLRQGAHQTQRHDAAPDQCGDGGYSDGSPVDASTDPAAHASRTAAVACPSASRWRGRWRRERSPPGRNHRAGRALIEPL